MLTIFKTPNDAGNSWRVWDNGNPGNGLTFNPDGTLSVDDAFATNNVGRHYIAVCTLTSP